jgi:hypothetical protein
LDRHVRLVSIPSSDAPFGALAEQTFASLAAERRGSGGAREDVAELERRLRRVYPGAVVRRQDPLARFGEGDTEVWYATNRAYPSRISARLDVPAPPELVFDLYVERYPEWQSAVAVRAVPPSEASTIAEFAARYDIFGRSFEGRFRIVELQRPAFVRVEATGTRGIEVWYVTTFARTPTGTAIEVVGDYDLPSTLLPGVQRFVADRVVARDIRRAHATLVELVEREAGRGIPARRAG